MKILVLGAGRSAGYLIEYLAVKCKERGWEMTVCDQDFTRLQQSFKINDSVKLEPIDVTDEQKLQSIITEHGIVVSLLPPFLHIIVAKLAINCGVSVFTASYISRRHIVTGKLGPSSFNVELCSIRLLCDQSIS